MIYIDADACPVREETVRVAERHGTPVVVVSNGGIRPSSHPLVEFVIVGDGADMADRWIAHRIGPGDVCITTDTVLAARVVEAGARVIRPNGDVLTRSNIGNALALRDLAADLRAADTLGPGGRARPFSRADRSRFLQALDATLVAISREVPGQMLR